MERRWRSVLVGVLFALLLPACSGITPGASSSAPPGAGQCRGGTAKTVPLQVANGPNGSTLALLPVSIDGKGPFPFTLDTGASQSLIDLGLVRHLHLHVTGKTNAQVMGVTGGARAKIVSVPSWKAGSVQLPSGSVFSLPLASPHGPIGLLGSDILSDFHSIEVDYSGESLTLCA